MTTADDCLIPLSALQHLLFCERQAALIHVEKIWIDNAYTVDGSHAHRRVDDTAPRRERRGDTVILRGLWLRSDKMGLIGRADVVEIHRTRDAVNGCEVAAERDAVSVDGLPGLWRFFPVEYKRGKPKQHRADEVQLCAQAMCIEEMNRVNVDSGALFYGRTQRRHEVEFDVELRGLVEQAASRMKFLIDMGMTPKPHIDSRCKLCSLAEVCHPCARPGKDASAYLISMIQGHLDEADSP